MESPSMSAANLEETSVSETRSNQFTAPGWYADPTGVPQQRWWDGRKWTEHQRGPMLDAGGVAPIAPAAAQLTVPKSANTVFIWIIVLLPILSLIAFASFDFADFVRLSGARTPNASQEASQAFGSSYSLLTVINSGVAVASLVLCYFDRRALHRLGIMRPFHWAWAFLGGAVYIVGRSIIVRRRTGGGLLPLWIYLGVVVATVIVTAVVAASLVSAIMATIPSSYR
jgi:hypothetical protein